jgi:hypothetical protein
MVEAKVDNTWYVAITKFAGMYSSFTGAGSNSYNKYAEIAKESGMMVVAEQFDVSDEAINRIDGFDENHQRVRESQLKIIIDRLNSGENVDVSVELGKICNSSN